MKLTKNPPLALSTQNTACVFLVASALAGCAPDTSPPSSPPVNVQASAPSADEAKVIAIVSELFGMPADAITTDRTLTDLGADSLDCVEVVMALEEEFDIEISDEKLEGVDTIGQFARMVGELKTP